jgi:hypothetical protein
MQSKKTNACGGGDWGFQEHDLHHCHHGWRRYSNNQTYHPTESSNEAALFVFIEQRCEVNKLNEIADVRLWSHRADCQPLSAPANESYGYLD